MKLTTITIILLTTSVFLTIQTPGSSACSNEYHSSNTPPYVDFSQPQWSQDVGDGHPCTDKDNCAYEVSSYLWYHNLTDSCQNYVLSLLP